MRDEWQRAASEGDVRAILALLDDGAAVDARDRYGQTALMLAATRGHEEAVRTLLAQGADMDVTAKYGLTALMLALLNRHHAVAKALVAAGADTRPRGTGAPGFAGKTAADLAQEAGYRDIAADIERRVIG
jgi:ankyrin repeat protein